VQALSACNLMWLSGDRIKEVGAVTGADFMTFIENVGRKPLTDEAV
jgi:hypothetical protein